MRLAVITLTRGNRPAYMAECTRSIAESLPADSRHIVSTCIHVGFQRRRFETTVESGAQYVAWVDDDDVVVGNALARCVEALDKTGAGLAFTHEGRMDAAGMMRVAADTTPRAITRRDIAMHPRSAHHLAVVRRACLPPVLLDQCESIGTGIDWMMRAYAGLVHGAVQVPSIGYLWRDHAGQESQTPEWNAQYAEAMPKLRALTHWWMGALDAPVPTYGEPT